MSTFDGIVHEFPDIRIDFFRTWPHLRPPLACFLSHVHSDHLAGLESLRSPFVYCSAATREILLRLEKYPCRINHARGILEARVQTYKHLKSLLKPLPLDTPTTLELEPGNLIQVTLLDANHCAVIEGDGKAVLYTGDIRSEPWWVNSIARNPSMVEYSLGLKTLDRIYLDTSILSNYELQSKAEGLRTLLEKVSKYPKDTVFYMQAWTYGYEEVWIALSKALKSKIHVDKYKLGVYKSLVAKSTDRFGPQFHHSKEAPFLVGFTCGNNQHDGCLTLDENVRIHSCEKGTACSVVQNRPIVWIKPVVAVRPGGSYITEIGVGGGGDDLEREVQITQEDMEEFINLVIKDEALTAEAREGVQIMLAQVLQNRRDLSLTMDVSTFTDDMNVSLQDTISSLVDMVKRSKAKSADLIDQPKPAVGSLPNTICFPYARHSSYPELKHLVETLKPRDVWPCTVEPVHWYQEGITMRDLFGSFCSGDVFEHDVWLEMYMRAKLHAVENEKSRAIRQDSQRTASSPVQRLSSPILPSSQPPALYSNGPLTPSGDPKAGETEADLEFTPKGESYSQRIVPTRDVDIISISSDSQSTAGHASTPPAPKRGYGDFSRDNESQQNEVQSRHQPNMTMDGSEDDEPEMQNDSQASSLSATAHETRKKAFKAMDGQAWGLIGLISTTDHHTVMDEELGGQ